MSLGIFWISDTIQTHRIDLFLIVRGSARPQASAMHTPVLDRTRSMFFWLPCSLTGKSAKLKSILCTAYCESLLNRFNGLSWFLKDCELPDKYGGDWEWIGGLNFSTEHDAENVPV